MAKIIGIEIPIKRYCKAYLLHHYGARPLMNTKTGVGNKFIDLLSHTAKTNDTPIIEKVYPESVKLYISYFTYRHRGGFIHNEQIQSFNFFLEETIKRTYRQAMDVYIEIIPSFESNLGKVREIIGISEDAWENESIKKDYYRYRKRTGLPLLYNTKNSPAIPNDFPILFPLKLR